LTQGINGSKFKSLDEVCAIAEDLRKQGKAVVQCHGVFDLLHPGHIRHLESAKRQGDVLVVTVTRDEHVGKGPGRPVFGQQLRVESLAALECVDYVALNEGPIAVDTILKLRPDVYAKGNEYADAKNDLTGKIVDEEQAVESVGGRIHFTDDITFSSTSLLNNHFDVFSEEARGFLTEFRSSFTPQGIIDLLQSLKGLKVLVIGDTIIDEYHYCSPMGKSPKEILIPARYLYEEVFAGGILAIANCVAGFCDDVELVTVLGGEDSREGFVRGHLRPNVVPTLFCRPDTCTPVKRRFVEVDLLRKMFEVSFIGTDLLPDIVSHEAACYLRSRLPDYDLVVVADYGHGFIDDRIIAALCDESRFLAINVQTNSANLGFNLVTRYDRADYVCIDETEARLATHDNCSPLEDLVCGIASELRCHRAVVTRGHRGSLVYANSGGFLEVPVFSREAVDRIGAGDAYFAVTAPCVAAGFPPELVGFIGNAVGALAIRIVGNRTVVDPVQLSRYVTTLLK